MVLGLENPVAAREAQGVVDVHWQKPLYFLWKYNDSWISHLKRTSIRSVAITESFHFQWKFNGFERKSFRTPQKGGGRLHDLIVSSINVRQRHQDTSIEKLLVFHWKTNDSWRWRQLRLAPQGAATGRTTRSHVYRSRSGTFSLSNLQINNISLVLTTLWKSVAISLATSTCWKSRPTKS